MRKITGKVLLPLLVLLFFFTSVPAADEDASQKRAADPLTLPGTLQPLPSPSYKPVQPPAPPTPSAPENRGAVNPQTGEYYPPSGAGIVNPRTGEYYPPSGRGYINPRTGAFYPGHNP
jgi:hypothetical protein